MNLLPQTQLTSLLTNLSQDLGPCLLNCSNSGTCIVNNLGVLACNCSQHKTGALCNIDKRPCMWPGSGCINNGTCTNIMNSNGSYTGYNCSCKFPYHGTNCENKIDLCSNVTCSKQGICKTTNDLDPKCSCLMGYEGDNCETESSSLKTQKKVSTAAKYIAYASVAAFYMMMFALDLLGYWIKKERRARPKKIITKVPAYKSAPGDVTRRIYSDSR